MPGSRSGSNRSYWSYRSYCCRAQPPYDSSCSIFESTQSNSPEVILPPQNSQIPLALTRNGEPQFGQFKSVCVSADFACLLRMNVQYSLHCLRFLLDPEIILPASSIVKSK